MNDTAAQSTYSNDGTDPNKFRCIDLRMTGRVQGVWYRASMQAKAVELGVAGWCKNCPDGAVEAQVYGPQADIDALIAWCHDGPELAQVSHVQVTPIELSAHPLPDEAFPKPFQIYR